MVRRQRIGSGPRGPKTMGSRHPALRPESAQGGTVRIAPVVVTPQCRKGPHKAATSGRAAVRDATAEFEKKLTNGFHRLAAPLAGGCYSPKRTPRKRGR